MYLHACTLDWLFQLFACYFALALWLVYTSISSGSHYRIVVGTGLEETVTKEANAAVQRVMQEATTNTTATVTAWTHAQVHAFYPEKRAKIAKYAVKVDVKMDTRLSVIKPLSARWITSVYDYIRKESGIIHSGFVEAGSSQQ